MLLPAGDRELVLGVSQALFDLPAVALLLAGVDPLDECAGSLCVQRVEDRLDEVSTPPSGGPRTCSA
jgi:hypothetical protein